METIKISKKRFAVIQTAEHHSDEMEISICGMQEIKLADDAFNEYFWGEVAPIMSVGESYKTSLDDIDAHGLVIVRMI